MIKPTTHSVYIMICMAYLTFFLHAHIWFFFHCIFHILTRAKLICNKCYFRPNTNAVHTNSLTITKSCWAQTHWLCKIPYRIVPYHTKVYQTKPHHTLPYHTVPYHTRPYHWNPSSLPTSHILTVWPLCHPFDTSGTPLPVTFWWSRHFRVHGCYWFVVHADSKFSLY